MGEGGRDMICPLMSRKEFVVLPEGCGPSDLMVTECREDKCAWWVPNANQCSMRAIGARAALDAEALKTHGEAIDRYEETH